MMDEYRCPVEDCDFEDEADGDEVGLAERVSAHVESHEYGSGIRPRGQRIPGEDEMTLDEGPTGIAAFYSARHA